MLAGILTPAAGRTTQQLPGPRVVDRVLPAGRVLLAGRFMLCARHGDEDEGREGGGGKLIWSRKDVPPVPLPLKMKIKKKKDKMQKSAADECDDAAVR